MCYDRRRAEACVDESAHHALGPVRNPVFLHRVRLFVFLSFGNRTQNSRVAGARPNHQADRGSDPNHRGIWSPPMAESHKTCEPCLIFGGFFPKVSCVCLLLQDFGKKKLLTLQQRDEKILVGLFLNTSPKVTQQSNQFSVGHGSQVT